MEFCKITENDKTLPGEYILHEPTREIVLCGSFNRASGKIKVLARGRLFADDIENFRKIKITDDVERKKYISRCKGCGK